MNDSTRATGPIPVGQAIAEMFAGTVPPRPAPKRRPQLTRCASCDPETWMDTPDDPGVLGFCTRCHTVDYGFSEWVL